MGMKYPLFSFFFISVLLVGCHSNQPVKHEAGLLQIPFEAGVQTERSVKLSQLADSVKLIALETNANCLLAKVKEGNILVAGRYIYILCSEGVLLFSDDGKFVKSISKRGQGPGEYSGIRYIGVNEQLNRFYIFSHGKAIVFTQDGDFLHECRIPLGWQYAFVGDSCIASYIYNNTGQKTDRIVLTNLKGDTLKRYKRSDLFTISSGMNYYMQTVLDTYFYTYQNNTYFKEYYNDTVFKVTPDTLLPHLTLQMGKYALPLEKRFEALDGDWFAFEKESAPYWRPMVFEGTHWLLIPYTSWHLEPDQVVRRLAIYNKSSEEYFSVKGGQIENDLDGSLPFYPTIRPGDDVLMQLWTATDILELAEENPDFLTDKRLQGLQEDSNPVLMIVYLKK